MPARHPFVAWLRDSCSRAEPKRQADLASHVPNFARHGRARMHRLNIDAAKNRRPWSISGACTNQRL